MTEEQFRAEKLYYISLSIAKSMLEKGVIDREVFTIIDTKLLENTSRFWVHYWLENR